VVGFGLVKTSSDKGVPPSLFAQHCHLERPPQCHAALNQYQQLLRSSSQQHIPSMLQEHSYYTVYPAMQQIRSRACCKQTFIVVAFTFTTPLIKPKPRILFSLSTATALRLTSLLLRCNNAATFLFTQHTFITSQRSYVAPHFVLHSQHFYS
jgi:hypothetical protein